MSELDVHPHERTVELPMEFFLFGSGSEATTDGHGLGLAELTLGGLGAMGEVVVESMDGGFERSELIGPVIVWDQEAS